MPGLLAPRNPRLDLVYDVIIDNDCTFNYILCKVYDPEDPTDIKYIVRGTQRAEFHSDLYDDIDLQMEEYGLICECLGGGRIFHDAKRQTIEVFGKSQGYGPANHSLAARILAKEFGSYKSIIWSDS